MKLTNTQKGQILLIPAYLIVTGIVFLMIKNIVIDIMNTPIKEIGMWVIIIILTVISIVGIDLIWDD